MPCPSGWASRGDAARRRREGTQAVVSPTRPLLLLLLLPLPLCLPLRLPLRVGHGIASETYFPGAAPRPVRLRDRPRNSATNAPSDSRVTVTSVIPLRP